MLSKEDIKKLFAVLQARYGHKWTTAYADQNIMKIAVNEWHRELQGFRPEDLRDGITRLDDDWPPTLPQFVKACLPPLSSLGIDIEPIVQSKIPKYHYEPGNPQEASRREREKIATREEVKKEAIKDAIKRINEDGIKMLNRRHGD